MTHLLLSSSTWLATVSYEINLLFFGALGMMIIYNFIYYLVLKSNTYIDYFFFHTLVFTLMFSLSGIALKEVHFFSYQVHNISAVLFLFATLSFTSFTRNFLELKKKAKQLDKTLVILQFINLFFIALAFMEIQEPFVINLAIAFVVLLIVVLLAISSYLGFSQNRMNARLYILGFSAIFVSLIYTFVAFLSDVNITQNIIYILEFGILFEAAIFSYALSFKYRQSKISLKQNELLFQELSHRVKNNLQSIISILSLQKSRLKDTEVKEQLAETIKRVRSISLIHEKLQHSELINRVNMQEFFTSLIEEFSQLNSEVKFQLECEGNLDLSVEKLTPLALIINELITNSMKHAFDKTQAPLITLGFSKKEDLYYFNYLDNGEGFKNEVKESLGTLLINTLSKAQLKGEFSVKSEKHYRFMLSFKE